MKLDTLLDQNPAIKHIELDLDIGISYYVDERINPKYKLRYWPEKGETRDSETVFIPTRVGAYVAVDAQKTLFISQLLPTNKKFESGNIRYRTGFKYRINNRKRMVIKKYIENTNNLDGQCLNLIKECIRVCLLT